MPYFPTDAERAYHCKGCGRWWIPGNRSCLVAHSPGSCCHEYERPASTVPPQIHNMPLYGEFQSSLAIRIEET